MDNKGYNLVALLFQCFFDHLHGSLNRLATRKMRTFLQNTDFNFVFIRLSLFKNLVVPRTWGSHYVKHVYIWITLDFNSYNKVVYWRTQGAWCGREMIELIKSYPSCWPLTLFWEPILSGFESVYATVGSRNPNTSSDISSKPNRNTPSCNQSSITSTWTPTWTSLGVWV